MRELFLKSGNLCAFPGCSHLIMDPQGVFIGEMCHIEGAEEGGERFNPNQTNEQRREITNLVLMCHPHHVITNDEAEYTPEKMKELKNSHEERVNDFARHLQFRISDLTERQISKPAGQLRRMHEVLNWPYVPEEAVDVVEAVNHLLALLRLLPLQTRQLLLIAVKRSHPKNYQGMLIPRHFSPEEVDLVCGRDATQTKPLYLALMRSNLVWDVEENETGLPLFALKVPNCDWQLWDDLIEFDRTVPGSLERLIIDLDASILD